MVSNHASINAGMLVQAFRDCTYTGFLEKPRTFFTGFSKIPFFTGFFTGFFHGVFYGVFTGFSHRGLVPSKIFLGARRAPIFMYFLAKYPKIPCNFFLGALRAPIFSA